MVNKDTSERPINNPIASAAWDARKKRKAAEAANELSKRQAIREISASRAAGKETRTGGIGGMVESGISKPHTGGLVTGLVDSGNKRRRSNSW